MMRLGNHVTNYIMEGLFEDWRKYLIESDNLFPHQLYVDLDGVLVDFEGGAVSAINKDLKNPSLVSPDIKSQRDYKKMVSALESVGRDLEITVDDFDKNNENNVKEVRNYMYRRLQNDLKFWEDLEWMGDGKELWEHVKNFDPPPIILTAPMKGEGSHEGKLKWVAKNLGLPVERVILSHNKWQHAVAESGAQNVLIDDTYAKVQPWVDEGGIGIQHIDADNSIEELNIIKKNSDAPEEPLE